ncbi:MAG: hypothetical protein HC796_12420 [Synechococcaceae cyanobacterium RL_1_2]|nr:hypothetical protein [Synechococcaceae cyanobacterium RL_1_2]
MIILAIALTLATLILLQNPMGVTVVWLGKNMLTLPLGILLVGSATAGLVAGIILQWILPLGTVGTISDLDLEDNRPPSRFPFRRSAPVRDEWDIENPPVQPTQINPPSRPDPFEEDDYQPPRSSPGPRQKKTTSEDGVYDANYRVIEPPASSPKDTNVNNPEESEPKLDQDWV